MGNLENTVALSFNEAKSHPALLWIVITLSTTLEQSEAESGMMSCTITSMWPSLLVKELLPDELVYLLLGWLHNKRMCHTY